MTGMRWFVLFCLVAALLLSGLGAWQLQRLGEKRALIARIDAALSAPATVLPAALADPPAWDYRRVAVRGRYLPDKDQRLGPRVREGRAGVHVLTPFRLDDGRVLLVNRGWIPTGMAAPAAGGADRLTGVLRTRFRRGAFVPEHQPGSDMWFWYDLPGLSAALQHELMPAVLELDAAGPASEPPYAGTTVVDIPNNHLQYALTWFALAGVVLVMLLVYRRQRRSRA